MGTDTPQKPRREVYLPASASEIFGTMVALVLLGIAQPIFDLLARNGTFFVARSSPAIDIVIFAFGITLLLPAVLTLATILAARLNAGLGRVFFFITTALLGTSVVLQVIRLAFPALGTSVLILLPAGALGAGIARLVSSSLSLRSLLRFSFVLGLAVVVWFLALSPLSQVVFVREIAAAPAGTIGRPADVVMLILDELPLATLLDKDRQIDAGLFPNFARLADSSTWYRNATTVSDNTVRAVPAILDGALPERDKLPTAGDHPHNVFTLLGADYEVEAEELVTRMCPTQICQPQVPSFGRRMRSLFGDIGLISAHMLLPKDLTRDLPPVDENWGDFAADDTASDVAGVPGARTLVGKGDPLTELGSFAGRIAPRDEPVFYFKHVLLPHAPWRYLPEGYGYPQDLPIPGTVPLQGSAGTRWDDNAWLAAQGYQRHILQTMAIDRVLGKLLDNLQSRGMYEDSLIVVLSDHGTSFQPGAPRRSTAPETVGELAPVPIFIKEPEQTSGRIVDVPVQTIDVLPTIAALLEATGVWDTFDGRALTEDAGGTVGRELGFGGDSSPYSDDGIELAQVVERKYEIFGPGDLDPYRLAPPGTRSLIGREAPQNASPADARATIEGVEVYSDIDLSGPTLPALLRGQIEVEQLGREDPVVAIALNGTITAVTEIYETSEGDLLFQAMLPPQRFVDGDNLIELFLVEQVARRAVLLSLSQE